VILEVRIPLSPLPAWFARTRLIAKSIRQFYPDAIVTGYIGADSDPLDTMALLPPPGDDIDWRIISRRDFMAWADTANPYVATMAARWQPPYRGTHILLLDADILPMARFDELFGIDAIQGVQAHVPALDNADWVRLFGHFDLPQPAMIHPYTGADIMCKPSTGPCYWNTGVVFGPSARFAAVSVAYDAILDRVRGILNSYFFDQIGLTLAVAEAKSPTVSLPLRYNFPNQPEFDAAHPAELADIRFLHYLRTDIIDRDRDFASPEATEVFLRRRDLAGSNERLRARVKELMEKEECP
jgi:hypothetical protein